MATLGVFQGAEPQILSTVNGVPLWRLTQPSVQVSAFNPVGPFPWTALFSRIDALLASAVGTAVAYIDIWSWKAYTGTISAIDTTARTITVTAANAPGSPITLPYGRKDGSSTLPITLLE
jgi:hypothetical protein